MIIDVSYFNNIYDWPKVAAAIDGIIIRLGYTGYGSGKPTLDRNYLDNLEYAKRYDIPRGVYYFPCSITAAEAKAEAEYIAGFIGGEQLKLGVWLDSEIADVKDKKGRADNLSKWSRTELLHIIIDRLKELGIVAGVYASTSWLLNNLNMGSLPGVPVWCAQYNKEEKCTYPGQYMIFQYSSKGSIPGIRGNVDLNRLVNSAEIVGVADPELDNAIDVIAQRVIAGKFGQGHDVRKNIIYDLIRKRVNDIIK